MAWATTSLPVPLSPSMSTVEVDFATLRTRVTSPGGTTERALQTMMHDAVNEAIGRALDSASARAAEMADQMGRDA